MPKMPEPLVHESLAKTTNTKVGPKSATDQILNKELSATDWFSDRHSRAMLQRNFALAVSFFLMICSVIGAFTLVFLVGSKTVEPFVIQVDKRTGVVAFVDPDTIKSYTGNEVVNNYFIYRYIASRELFDPRNYKYNYYVEARLMSSSNVYSAFLRTIRPDSTDSPMSAFANNSDCSLKIRSIQNLGEGNVQVRFRVEAVVNNGTVLTKDRVVMMNYEYRVVDMTEEYRFVNPLGFTVTNYRVSNETL